MIIAKLARLEVLTGIEWRLRGSNGEYYVSAVGGGCRNLFSFFDSYHKSKELDIYLNGVIAGLEFNRK